MWNLVHEVFLTQFEAGESISAILRAPRAILPTGIYPRGGRRPLFFSSVFVCPNSGMWSGRLTEHRTLRCGQLETNGFQKAIKLASDYGLFAAELSSRSKPFGDHYGLWTSLLMVLSIIFCPSKQCKFKKFAALRAALCIMSRPPGGIMHYRLEIDFMIRVTPT